VKIAEASIDEAHIKDAAITAAKIQDAAITSAKIGDLSADKIKAGVLTVTDQVGAGASGIIVKSGTAERVRLDKNGITVNDGNIIVRSPTGATMISAQGINVNEFTENVMRGFNLVRNPFWIDRRREHKTRWIQTYSDKNHLFSGSPASRALHQIISATVDGKEYIYVFYAKYTGNADQPAVCRYYPPTATWETMSKIPVYAPDRHWFSIQKSSDNKVYLFGGIKNGAITNECWEYDLDTDSWQQKASMPKGLTQIVSLLVGNKIYVFGGFDSTGTWNRYCYIYDITTNSWAQGWQIPYEDHYSVAYYGGYIYVFCLQVYKRILKYTTSGSLVSNETYDKDVPYYNANCVYGSKIYFVGGVKEIVDGYVTDHADSCISYDFDTKTFEDLANLPFKIHFTSVCVVTKLGSNTYYGVSEFPRLYIIGGYTIPETQTVPGIELKEVYMLPLYSGETDSEGYYFDDWNISKDDSSLQVVWKPAGTKGNGRITFTNPNQLYNKRVILSQFVDLSKIDTSSPYTLSSYSQSGVAHQHLSSRIGDKSFVDSIYSLIEEGFIERTFENLPNEGEYLLELCIRMFGEDHYLNWFYGIQLEKGKMSSGIVAPHLEDLGLPLGSIRPEHLYESAIPPGAIMPFARP
ncbi:MAG TPA: kelch repeat-containing protein, partial [Fervidobacterium sp.]|nr:kelch repeat-containing protein [Fervidobacterium sp.]